MPPCYKYCIVPRCENTSTNMPDKLFFCVPKDPKTRKKWCRLMRRDDRQHPLSCKSTLFCCEDHFDVETDMESYQKFKMMGGKKSLKKGVEPHKFACQGRKNKTAEKAEKPAYKKRRLIELLESALNPDITHENLTPQLLIFQECDTELDTNNTNITDPLSDAIHTNSLHCPISKSDPVWVNIDQHDPSTPEWNVCRCCSSLNGSFTDLFSEHIIGEKSEIYETMVKDVFNIQMSHNEAEVQSNTMVCDGCVTKIQEASAFRDMVLQTELMYAKYLNDLDLYDKQKNTDVTSIKTEPNLDNECDLNLDEDSSLEDEPLSNMKGTVGDSMCGKALMVKAESLHDTKKALRCRKTNMEIDNYKSRKDWSKLTERRGFGPLLRENSLTLLKHSTICVFQWFKSKYTCFCCQTPFTNMDELRDHTTNEHTLKDVKRKIIAQQNMLVKVDVSILKCKLCEDNIEDLQRLREHLICEHNVEFRPNEHLLVPFKIQDDVFQCQICMEKFTVFRLLNIHMNRHYKNQVCHVCGAAFSNLKLLNLHKSRMHRQWQCKDCDLKFTSGTEKKKHDILIHKMNYVRKKRFPCPHCDERYYQESAKILHLVEKHGLSKPKHECSVCNKTFVTKSICNNHVKSVHLKEKKYSCDLCNNRFYTKSDVARHQGTHSGVKKFTCIMCNGLFASKDSLRRHVKRTH